MNKMHNSKERDKHIENQGVSILKHSKSDVTPASIDIKEMLNLQAQGDVRSKALSVAGNEDSVANHDFAAS